MIYITGLAIMITGIFLFMIPITFNKFERLVEIGFLVFCLGAVICVIGAIMTAIN